MTKRDWFEVTGNARDDLPICMAVRNPATGRIGGNGTPREDTLTACGNTWADRHVTLLGDLVTCEACARWCQTPEGFAISFTNAATEKAIDAMIAAIDAEKERRKR